MNAFWVIFCKKQNLRGKVCETSQPVPRVPRPIHDTRGRLPLENFLQVFETKKLLDVSKTLMDAFRVNVLPNKWKKNSVGEGVRD